MDRNRILLLALIVAFMAVAFVLSRCEDERLTEGQPEVAEGPEVSYPRDRPDPVRMRGAGRRGRAGDAPLDTSRPQANPKKSRDRVEAALSAPGGGGSVFVELNAIRHSPVAEKILRCREQEAMQLFEDMQERLGIDPSTDIDRIGLSGDSLAVSGFFDKLKVPGELGEGEAYGGARIFESTGSNVDVEGAEPEKVFFGVVGEDVIVTGPDRDSVAAAVDRVEGRAPVDAMPPMAGARGEIYGRFGPAFVAGLLGRSEDPVIGKLASMLQGGVVRMNIDEHVSMSLDLEAQDEATANDLAQTVGGLFAAARIRAQEEGRPEVAKLLEQARVLKGDGGGFDVDVAVPGDVILEALGCDSEGRPRGSTPPTP